MSGYFGGTFQPGCQTDQRSRFAIHAPELHSSSTKSRGFRVDVRYFQQNPIPTARVPIIGPGLFRKTNRVHLEFITNLAKLSKSRDTIFKSKLILANRIFEPARSH